MKKLKLLMAFCALLLGWSNASAQKDVTSQYITNATLSNGLTGWTVNNFNNPVRGNNTTGYASECWAGNPLSKESYSMTQTITLPAGNYQLVNYSFYRYSWGATDNPNKSLAKLKAGTQEVAIKTLGGITAAGYANSQAEGANCFDSKMYRNTVDFTVAADNTPVEIGIYGTHDAAASWVIAGMFELINLDEPATMDAPFDVTGYITNPGFEYRDLTGWTVSPDGYFGTQSNNQGFKVGGWYAEKWQGSGALPAGSATQTLTSLPAGYYKLTANLGGNGTYIDLNGKTASWTADKDYTVGYVLSENEDLTITFGKTAEGTANWIHFDNFRLQFCGDVAEALNTLLNTAENLLNDAAMQSSVKSDLQTAYTTYNKSYSDVDELLAAIAAMQEVVDAAQASATIYNNISTAISNYAGKAAALDAAGQAAYDASGVQTKYNNGTYVTLAEAETELQTALLVAVKAQTTGGSDWTDVITNPSFETGNFNGWTNDGMATQGNDSFEKDGTYYAEAWQPNGTKSVKQTISAMPAGVYRLSAKSKARGVTSAKVSANGIDKAITIGDATDTYSVEFACDANADVEIGFEGVGTGAGSSWLCVDNFRLTLVSSGLPDVVAVTGKMNAEIASAQTTAIETYTANRTVDNYNAASAAIAAAQASKDAYAAGKAALDKVAGILENTNVYTADAYSTFNSAYTTAAGKYEDESWTSEEANAYVRTVFGTGWRSNATIDDFLISAWDVAPRTWDSYHVNTWSTISDSNNPNFFAPCIEYWTGDDNTLANKLMTATISGKTPGDTYKVEAKVCVGVNTGLDASTAPTGISLQLNDGEIINVCSGARTADTRFYEGDFEASGIVGMDGNLYVKFNVAETNVSWMTFRNVKYTLTSAAPAATDEQKAALADAISDAEANTLGFEAGEYAPYNNVAAIEALATAKAIDPATATGYAVVTATDALEDATWTANVVEVNAVYDGTFEIQEEHTTGPTALAGWNNPEGLRQLIKNTTTYPGLNTATDNAGFFAWGSTALSYGNTTGYTMPLAAHTIYELRFKTCGWADGDMGYVSASVLNASNEGLATTNSATATKRITESDPWVEFSAVFETGEAGDYTLGMRTSKHAVITDITLYQVPAQSATIGSNGYTTFASPYALDLTSATQSANGFTAYRASAVNDETVTFKDDVDQTVVANTGVLLQGEPNAVVTIPVVVSGSALADNALQVNAAGTTFAAAANTTYYGMNKGSNPLTFGIFDPATVAIPASKAYLALTSNTAREIRVVFGDITAVDNVKAATEATLKDGKYLENGKVVIVKNGKKFNATGAQMK